VAFHLVSTSHHGDVARPPTAQKVGRRRRFAGGVASPASAALCRPALFFHVRAGRCVLRGRPAPLFYLRHVARVPRLWHHCPYVAVESATRSQPVIRDRHGRWLTFTGLRAACARGGS